MYTATPSRSINEIERELFVKFTAPIIVMPEGIESGGSELISLPDHPAGKLLLESNLINIRHIFPEYMRRDSVTYNPYGIAVRVPNHSGEFVLTFGDRGSRDEILNELQGTPDVLWVEPNEPEVPCVVPDDPFFWMQWSLDDEYDHDIDAPEAWDIETGSENTIIAIIDEGVLSSHEDLSWRVYGDANSSDHGTHVAGIAAATGNNDTGIAGVHWCASLLNKYANNDASISATKTREAVDAGAHILNNSYGNYTWYSFFFIEVAYAYKMNRVFVGSKGNDGSGSVHYPSDYEHAFGVGGSTSEDFYWPSSNYGAGIDVSAPAVEILSTMATTPSSYAWMSGTSMAASHVSGLAALLHSHEPTLNNDDIMYIIRYSADDIDEDPADVGYDERTGWGRINARKALEFLEPPYRLDHFTTTGGGIHYTHPYSYEWFLDVSGLAPVNYWTFCHEIRTDVTFPHEYAEVPLVWGRGNASIGYSDALIHSDAGYVGVVDGSLTTTGCTLRTYVYDVYTVSGGHVGWFPCEPLQVQYAYTVLAPVDQDGDGIDDDMDICPYTYNPEQDSAALREWSALYYGTDGFHDAKSVLPMYDGSYLVAGSQPDPVAGCYYHLWKVDPCGGVIWDRPCCGPPFKTTPGNKHTLPTGAVSDERNYYQKHPMVEPTADSGFIVLTNDGSLALVKLDHLGNQQWYQHVQNGWPGFSVHQTSDGGYLATIRSDYPDSRFLEWRDADGNLTWWRDMGAFTYGPYNGMDARETSDGGTIFVTDWPTGGPTGTDIRVVKLDAGRNVEWDQTYDGLDTDQPLVVFEDTGSGYVIAGNVIRSGNNWDMRLMKINTSGSQVLWDSIYGGPDDQFMASAIPTADGFLLIGCTDGPGAVAFDLFVIETNKQGEQQWWRMYNGIETACGQSCAATDDGGFILGGTSSEAGNPDNRAGMVIKIMQPSSCCIRRGDVNHDGAPLIDVADLVYLVDYMYVQGSPPPCWDEGDVDGSGIPPIDMGDLVYLVDYMFSGGPLPPPCP